MMMMQKKEEEEEEKEQAQGMKKKADVDQRTRARVARVNEGVVRMRMV